jgi:hypothetical protein
MEVIAMVILFSDLITVTGIMAGIEAAILFMGGIMDIVVLFMDDVMAMAAIQEGSETAGIMDIADTQAIASADKEAAFLHPVCTRCEPG